MKLSLKSFALLLTAFIHFNGASQREYHVSLGLPIGVSKEAKSFIQDSFQLEGNGGSAISFGYRYLFKSTFFFGGELSLAGRSYSSDSLTLNLGDRVGTFVFGKQFDLSEKFALGALVHFGAQRAYQTLKIVKNNVDAWDVFQNDTYTSYYKETKPRFFMGGDVYAQYGKGEPFIISLGIKASFLPLRKLDTLNSIPVYQNYFLPYFAFRMTINRDDDDKRQ